MEAFNALSDKHKKFITEYVIDFSATRAAIRAGYAESRARQTGYDILQRDDIKAAMDDIFDGYVMSAQETLYHLSVLARGDMALVTNEHGGPDMKAAKDNGATNLIKKIKSKTTLVGGKTEDEDVEVHEEEIEIHDRVKALDLLAKYHKLTTATQTDITSGGEKLKGYIGISPDVWDDDSD